MMRRGLIVVTGNTGDFTGAFMIAGSIVVLGQPGIRAGAGLLRGTIITFHEPELLPTFRFDCSYRPAFLDLLFRDLQRYGLSIADDFTAGLFRRFS